MCCIYTEMNCDVMATGLREQMGSPYGKQSGRWWRERERNSVKYNPQVLGGKAEITENQVGQEEDRDFYKVDLIVTRQEVIRSALLAHRDRTSPY